MFNIITHDEDSEKNFYWSLNSIDKAKEDEEYMVLTDDLNPNRFNLYLKDKKIKIPEIKEKAIIKIPTSKLIKKKDEIIILGHKEEHIDLENFVSFFKG